MVMVMVMAKDGDVDAPFDGLRTCFDRLRVSGMLMLKDEEGRRISPSTPQLLNPST